MSSASLVVDVAILSMTCSLDAVDLIFSLDVWTIDGEDVTKVGFVVLEDSNALAIEEGDVDTIVVVVDALIM